MITGMASQYPFRVIDLNILLEKTPTTACCFLETSAEAENETKTFSILFFGTLRTKGAKIFNSFLLVLEVSLYLSFDWQ